MTYKQKRIKQENEKKSLIESIKKLEKQLAYTKMLLSNTVKRNQKLKKENLELLTAIKLMR